jgi:hypothetical protein
MSDLKNIKAQALEEIDQSFHHLQEAVGIVFDDMMTEELDQLFKTALLALADLKGEFLEDHEFSITRTMTEEDAAKRGISLSHLQELAGVFEERYGHPAATLEELDNWMHEITRPESLLEMARRLTAFRAAHNGYTFRTIEELEAWEATPNGIAALSPRNN